MPRYATIIIDDHGAEIVSAIGEFESSGLPRRAGRVEEVAPGVRIGMVRGGPIDAVGGFGFSRQGLDHTAIAAAASTLKAAAAPKLPISPLVGEMAGRPEGGAVPPTLPAGKPASDQAVLPRRARAKPRKKPPRKAGKAKAASSRAPEAATHG
ncbi:hypothetical protein [Mesorhizobium sp.]|uniref:hypothetical protein n=1 Tax=Mesorhizobium sp. TaxID=1871066 RepID=UPI000FE4CF22|nr:hypothetical protein [Mesorhizobium sp.]RWM20459.1 MAG: hypothetical protein EOR74_30815 [Mesorhizobium sp.]RWM37174.1 MAG: hypothetical protein EOR75_20800 [Mesorhizobium sp.]TIO81327.1 MAG: hypothetical protein E5X74_29160 [Mesorhizobium sp.]TJV51269.1 MAG: hypothetical protein E5Y01_15115 [Mesorhizobium sp.]